MSTTCIGIDLGTTYSVTAIVDEIGFPRVLRNAEGKTTTPSVIYFGEDEPIVGEEAKDQQAFGSTEVASFFKRMMGDLNFSYEFNGKIYDAIELSSILLKKLKRDAEAVLKEEVYNAVITVPAYFNNLQREATIKAGKMASLNVLRIINEPTAAAIAYGLNEIKQKRNIMVYDLGGGTFDVTIAHIDEQEINVIATNGDHSLGGKDWDDRLATYISEQFYEEHGVDPLDDEVVLNEILVDCEKVKKNLTDLNKVNMSVLCKGKKSTYEITRPFFEKLTTDLIERTWNLADLALSEVNLSWSDIDDMILVGGSTKMQMVSTYIAQKIGKPPLKGLNVDEVVACGAAIQAKIENDQLQKKVSTYQLNSYKKVQDVMSHSLGMVTISDDETQYVNSMMIRRNCPIPAIKTRPFQLRTFEKIENQLEVYVTQGESNLPLETDILGKYVISGITHNPAGLSNIVVSYSYDANGVVIVTAVEEQTGQSLNIIKEPVLDDISWMGRPPVQEEVSEELSVVMAFDLSGSMSGNPLKKAKEAATNFVDQFDLNYTQLGIIGFADTVGAIQEISNESSTLKNSVNRLDMGTFGYGNSAEPFTTALKMLENRSNRQFVIVLTDGMWNSPGYAIQKAEECKQANIEIIAIGFGSADRKFLSKIATSDENALFTNENQLTSSFSKIAREIKEKSNSLTFTK